MRSALWSCVGGGPAGTVTVGAFPNVPAGDCCEGGMGAIPAAAAEALAEFCVEVEVEVEAEGEVVEVVVEVVDVVEVEDAEVAGDDPHAARARAAARARTDAMVPGARRESRRMPLCMDREGSRCLGGE